MQIKHGALVAALAVACAADESTTDTTESVARQASYQGIYLLGNEALNDITETDRPFIDGYALRAAWIDLDTGTHGPAYDFSVVESAVAQLAAMNKKLTITIDAQLVPTYVLDNAATTYLTTVPGPGHTTYTALTAVTWDPNTLTSYTAFMTALANDPVCPSGTTCLPSQRIALKNHPTLAGLRINIIGMGKLRQTSNNTPGTIFEVPSYMRSTFVAAVIANIHAAQDQFPAIASWIPYFSVDDSISGTRQDPTLDEVLIAAITTEFDGVHQPAIGFFQELLKGDTPSATGTDGGNLLAARAGGAFVTFQACGGWTNASLCNFTTGDTTPQNGFDLGYGTYGTQYYELYAADVTNPSLAAMFTLWDPFLRDPASSPNPVGLVARAGSMSNRNVLTWSDTSTLETGFIVERARGGGSFVPIGGTLPSNTTMFVDDTALPGTTYSYRVHAVGTAGDLVLSNVAVVAGH